MFDPSGIAPPPRPLPGLRRVHPSRLRSRALACASRTGPASPGVRLRRRRPPGPRARHLAVGLVKETAQVADAERVLEVEDVAAVGDDPVLALPVKGRLRFFFSPFFQVPGPDSLFTVVKSRPRMQPGTPRRQLWPPYPSTTSGRVPMRRRTTWYRGRCGPRPPALVTNSAEEGQQRHPCRLAGVPQPRPADWLPAPREPWPTAIWPVRQNTSANPHLAFSSQNRTSASVTLAPRCSLPLPWPSWPWPG